MDVFIVGKLIKEFRERQKISQEELSFGLCAVSTLSRLETGTTTPNKNLVESLLSRLGVSIPTSNIAMTQIELKRWEIARKIILSVCEGNCEIKDLLTEYKNLGEMDFLEKQEYEFYSAIYEFHQDIDKKIVLEHFINSIKYTVPDYELVSDFSNRRFFSNTELMIMNNIALTEYELENTEKAIKILKFIKSYYETKSLDQSEIAHNLPVIIYNLSSWIGILGNDEEALNLAEEGIKICVKYGQLQYFSGFIYIKAYALAKLGKREEAFKHFSNVFEIIKYTNDCDLNQLIPQVNKEFVFNFEI